MMTDREKQLESALKLLNLPPSEEGVSIVPRSLNVRFLDTVIKLSYDAKPYWRTYAQYWLLFQEFAAIGTEMRQLMIRRGYIKFLVHIYLGEVSPYFVGKKQEKSKDKNVIEQERQALLNQKHILGAISYTVRGCRIKRCSSNTDVGPSPSQITDDLIDLPIDEFNLIFFTNFLSFAILHDNTDAMADLCKHFCWENMDHSEKVIEIVCEAINRFDWEYFPPFFSVLKAILFMQDRFHAQRINHALDKYMKVIDSNLKYKIATKVAIQFLVECVQENNKLIADFLRSNMGTWVRPWLVYGDRHESEELVRFTAELLLLELVPGRVGYVVNMKPEMIPTSLKDATKTQSVAPGWEKDLHSVIRTLFGLFDPLSQTPYITTFTLNDNAISDEKDTKSFSYFSLFRLLQWCIATPADQQLILEDNYMECFFNLFHAINSKKVDCDLNKAEFFKFWDKLTDDHPVIVQHFAEKSTCDFLFDTYIKIQASKQIIAYNNDTLPFLYKLFLKFCDTQSDFKGRMVRNPNFYWAIRYMLLESRDYLSVAVVLRELTEVSLQLVESRKPLVLTMLQFGIPASTNNWATVFELLARVLRDEPEQILFCSSGGMNNLIDVLDKRKEWNVDDLVLFIKPATNAISWMRQNSLSAENQLLKETYLERLEAISDKLSFFLPSLKLEHLIAGKSILDFLSVAVECDVRTLQHIIKNFNLQNVKEPLGDEMSHSIVKFIHQLCERGFHSSLCSDNDPLFLETLALALRNGLNSFYYPTETTSSILDQLNTVWKQAKPDLLQQQQNTENGGAIEVVRQALMKRPETLLKNGQLLSIFLPRILNQQVASLQQHIQNNCSDEFVSNEINKILSQLQIVLQSETKLKETLYKQNFNYFKYFEEVCAKNKETQQQQQTKNSLLELVKFVKENM